MQRKHLDPALLLDLLEQTVNDEKLDVKEKRKKLKKVFAQFCARKFFNFK